MCDEKGTSLVTIYSKYPQEEKPPFHSRCIVTESALSSRDWTEVTEMTKAALMEAGIDCDLVDWVWVKEMAAKNNARMTTKEFVRILNGVNDRVEILGDYMSALDKLPCRCRDCGYEWFATPNKLLYGRGCPKCAVRQRAEANRYTDEQFKALFPRRTLTLIQLIRILTAARESDADAERAVLNGWAYQPSCYKARVAENAVRGEAHTSVPIEVGRQTLSLGRSWRPFTQASCPLIAMSVGIPR